jgi:uncharacterized protein (DUF924 family)
MTRTIARTVLASPEDVLAFWFPERIESESHAIACARRWFAGGPAFDDEVHARFFPTIEAALEGKLDDWASSIRGRLALVIVLDQFTRNAFRGYEKAWHGDARALALCLEALDRGLDRGLDWIERSFLAMPLHHAEDALLASRATRVARQELPLAPPHLARVAEARIEQAEKYQTVLARFGRFPFRNAGLGRPTTTDERVFLADFVAAPSLMRLAASF